MLFLSGHEIPQLSLFSLKTKACRLCMLYACHQQRPTLQVHTFVQLVHDKASTVVVVQTTRAYKQDGWLSPASSIERERKQQLSNILEDSWRSWGRA